MCEETEAQAFDREQAAKAQAAYCKEKGWPLFAGKTGNCFGCRKNVYDRHATSHARTLYIGPDGFVVDRAGYEAAETGISVEEAGSTHVTSCPHCNYSFFD